MSLGEYIFASFYRDHCLHLSLRSISFFVLVLQGKVICMKYLLSILLISCVSAIVAVDIDLSEVVLSDKSTVAMEKFRASMLEENDIYITVLRFDQA